MRDRLRNRLEAGRQDDGFTLIELLIVIVILGILAGIVVFAVGGITDRGQTSACKSDKKTLQVAEEAAFAQGGAYLTEANLVPKFLAEVSTLYDVAPSGTTYTITAVAPCT
jgi:general secretion pathway protein G